MFAMPNKQSVYDKKRPKARLAGFYRQIC